jgi:hypothetical protein
LGADDGNPRGFWEPRKAISINEKILYRYNSTWYDPSMRTLDDDVFGPQDRAARVAEIASYLSTLPAAPFVVIKEPRITTMSDLWFEAARLAGLDVAAVIAVRHPEEVSSSVVSRFGFSPELASALWLKYNLLAERNTRDVRRVFVDYGNLLVDWRSETKRISVALDIDMVNEQEAEIDQFLTADLQRHRQAHSVTDHFGGDWVSTVHEELCGAARDEPCDESVLDGVFDSYCASERAFRTAFGEFGKHAYGLRSRVLRPAIVERMIELQALSRRRRGTWA